MATQDLFDERTEGLIKLRREAEKEMRRNLDDVRPHKRPKQLSGGTGAFIPVDRYRYAVVEELEAGAKGFLVTCDFRKEKSATREAVQLLRRYMPDQLFPAEPEPEPEPTTEQGTQSRAAALEAPVGAGAKQAGEEPEGAPAESFEAELVRGRDPKGASRRRELKSTEKDGGRQEQDDGDSDDYTDAHGDDTIGDGRRAADADGTVQRPGDSGYGGGAPGGAQSPLALAKVGCRGVVLMRLSAAAATVVDPVVVVEAMLRDREAGRLAAPTHCQRITPLDSTCALTAAGLSRAMAQATAAYAARSQHAAAGAPSTIAATTTAGVDETATATAPSAAPGIQTSGDDVTPAEVMTVQPFTYAVVYHNRQTEQPAVSAGAPLGVLDPATANSVVAGESTGVAALPSEPCAAAPTDFSRVEVRPSESSVAAEGAGGSIAGLEENGAQSDRGRIISTVAAGMTAAFGLAAKVQLKKPQVAVLVELVPVAGRPLAGVTVLPQHLFISKGKLLMKSLVSKPTA